MNVPKVFIDEAMKEIAKGRVILDAGGASRFQKWLAPYEPLFKDCDFKTLDIDPASGADVVGDIHAIPLGDASIDGIICHSTLEHVRDPLLAMRELKRILRPHGRLFLHVPSMYPYHARKGVYAYPDYWRVFEETMVLLTEGFSSVTIEKRGGYFLALSFFFPLQHKLRFVLDPIANGLDALFQTKKRSTTAGYYVLAIK